MQKGKCMSSHNKKAGARVILGQWTQQFKCTITDPGTFHLSSLFMSAGQLYPSWLQMTTISKGQRVSLFCGPIFKSKKNIPRSLQSRQVLMFHWPRVSHCKLWISHWQEVTRQVKIYRVGLVRRPVAMDTQSCSIPLSYEQRRVAVDVEWDTNSVHHDIWSHTELGLKPDSPFTYIDDLTSRNLSIFT